MKGKKIREWLSNRKIVTSCAAVALAVVIGGVSLFSGAGEAPEFPSYTDPMMVTSIQEEETPLASQPKTTTTTSKKTKTTRKKVKLKKASKKTYTKKLKTKKKVTNSSKTTSTAKVATKKTVVTNTTEKYTKKSKTKVVTAKVTTTVQTTTTQQVAVSNENAVSTAASSAAQTNTAASSSAAQAGKHEVSVTAVAGKMDSRVISAFQRLGFKVYVDSSVNYSGYFDARSRSITMKETSDATYHELGHFLAFIAGNVDKSSSFQAVYNAEKANVTSFNKAYVTQNASEYFAESVRDYILNNASLKSSRPQTYAAVQNALNQITDAQIAKIQKIYGAFWN